MVSRYADIVMNKASEILKIDSISPEEKLMRAFMAMRITGEVGSDKLNDIHKTENILLHQKTLNEIVTGMAPILVKVIEEGIELNNTFISYLFIGICWSIFHFPQIFAGLIYPGSLIKGLIIHTFILVSFGIILCYLREKSASLVCTSITHGLFNVLIYTQATDVISKGNQVIEGTLWAILFFTIVIVLFLKNDKKQHYFILVL